jgi:hypothetical protein
MVLKKSYWITGVVAMSLTKIKLAVVLVLLLIPAGLFAETTTGGVNWLDSLTYTKPAFVPITSPDEATCPNKYYVDFTNGSGSTCSQGSPCKAITTLAGKSGMSGGPAYVYVKGNGRFTISGVTFYGSAGNEIVIKPWPGDTTTVYLFTGPSSTSWNQIGNYNSSSANIHHIIVDGGPNLQFDFINAGSDYNNSTGFATFASDITIARCRFRAPTAPGALMSPCSSYDYDYTCNNNQIINNEFYDGMHIAQGSDSEQNYGIYAGNLGPCESNAIAITNMTIKNNIFRNLGSLGIQIEPRKSVNGAIIEGNAFHDLGQLSCGSRWHCRPAISIADSCGATHTNGIIQNNLMWNIASSCVWQFTPNSGGNNQIVNNTCYNYGTGSPQDESTTGFSSYNNTGKAIIRNNIILATSNNPLDGSSWGTVTNNLCLTGKSCGTSSQTDSIVNTFISTSTSSASFLRIPDTSKAVDHGYATGVTTYYFGSGTRSGTIDIGADEYGIGEVPPSVPTIIGVTLSGGNLQ